MPEEKVSDVKFEEFIELVAEKTMVSSAGVKAVFDRSTSWIQQSNLIIRALEVLQADNVQVDW